MQNCRNWFVQICPKYCLKFIHDLSNLSNIWTNFNQLLFKVLPKIFSEAKLISIKNKTSSAVLQHRKKYFQIVELIQLQLSIARNLNAICPNLKYISSWITCPEIAVFLLLFSGDSSCFDDLRRNKGF